MGQRRSPPVPRLQNRPSGSSLRQTLGGIAAPRLGCAAQRQSRIEGVELRLGAEINPVSHDARRAGNAFAKIRLMQDLRLVAAGLDYGDFAVEGAEIDFSVGGHGGGVITAQRIQPLLLIDCAAARGFETRY